jgi:hypothetical protein
LEKYLVSGKDLPNIARSKFSHPGFCIQPMICADKAKLHLPLYLGRPPAMIFTSHSNNRTFQKPHADARIAIVADQYR